MRAQRRLGAHHAFCTARWGSAAARTDRRSFLAEPTTTPRPLAWPSDHCLWRAAASGAPPPPPPPADPGSRGCCEEAGASLSDAQRAAAPPLRQIQSFDAQLQPAFRNCSPKFRKPIARIFSEQSDNASSFLQLKHTVAMERAFDMIFLRVGGHRAPQDGVDSTPWESRIGESRLRNA